MCFPKPNKAALASWQTMGFLPWIKLQTNCLCGETGFHIYVFPKGGKKSPPDFVMFNQRNSLNAIHFLRQSAHQLTGSYQSIWETRSQAEVWLYGKSLSRPGKLNFGKNYNFINLRREIFDKATISEIFKMFDEILPLGTRVEMSSYIICVYVLSVRETACAESFKSPHVAQSDQIIFFRKLVRSEICLPVADEM